jgi:hypothetical protein
MTVAAEVQTFQRTKESASFCKKKQKSFILKNFFACGTPSDQSRTSPKIFWFFFIKKNAFFLPGLRKQTTSA